MGSTHLKGQLPWSVVNWMDINNNNNKTTITKQQNNNNNNNKKQKQKTTRTVFLKEFFSCKK